MMPLTSMQRAAAVAAAMYGLTTLVGGIYGYVVKDSKASLIAGVAFGVILLASAALSFRKPFAGLVIACLASLALVGRFAKAAADVGAVSPIAGIMIGGGLLVLALAGTALVRRPQTPPGQ